MDFYDFGPNSFNSSVVDFTERDVVGGVDVFNRFSAWLAAGARLEGAYGHRSAG